MATKSSAERQAIKTPEAAFVHVLQDEFKFSVRVSGELLQVAQEMLIGHIPATHLRPGQVRVVVASLAAPFGPPLEQTNTVEVTLTRDAGAEDAYVRQRDGSVGLRHGRILRMVDEALEQGAVLTQDDLAQVLGVDTRTIRRDVQSLKAQGHLMHTRGPLKGVGRGQTHKTRIIELWLDRTGYDQIARWMHHTPQAIKRYIGTFLRVVALSRKGASIEEIAFLTQSSVRLASDYLALYEGALSLPHRREKLEEELARVMTPAERPEKTGQKGGPER